MTVLELSVGIALRMDLSGQLDNLQYNNRGWRERLALGRGRGSELIDPLTQYWPGGTRLHKVSFFKRASQRGLNITILLDAQYMRQALV